MLPGAAAEAVPAADHRSFDGEDVEVQVSA